jgi:signal transduction histidine kinase
VNRLKAIGGSARGSVVVARDVTDQVEAESARVRLLRRVLTAQEDERRRIAKELHDGLGQALVSLAVGLATITPESTAAEVRERVERLGQIAAETLQDVRRLTRGLRPMVLDDLGLLTALSRLTELFTQVHGVQASFVARGRWLEQLPGEVESALYRIAQEALANIAKHADAKTVAMTLEDVNDSICLCLTDDGRGFRNQPARRGVANEGFGISGMRERASILGGSFRIDSALGVGTTIHVCIPIKGGKP